MMKAQHLLAALVLCLAVQASAAAISPDEIPPAEAERLWAGASRLLGAQLRGIHSLQGRYTYRLYDYVTGRTREYRVEFAFEDGMLLDSQTYLGKSYQSVESNWVSGGGEFKHETASLGGKEGEVRRREIGFVFVGRKDDLSLLSCNLPHGVAEYTVLRSLLESEPRCRLARATRDEQGRVRFELVSAISGARFKLTCDPAQSYMPLRVETHVPQEGVERHLKTIEITYTACEGGDGSTWYYPTSGRVTGHLKEGDVVLNEWTVDVPSLAANKDIPDQWFLIEPADDESLVRQGDMKVLQPRRVPREAKQVASSAPRQQPLPQEIYRDQRNWWRVGGISAGAVMIAAGVVIMVRRKGV